MQYNILLVANDLYFKLLHVCLKSICSACNMEKIYRIFVADLGLREDNIAIIKKLSDKIEIIDTKTQVGNSKELYSQSWIDAVSQKTAILKMLVDAGHTPVVMLDSDTLTIDDFSHTIDPGYDIQICKRSSPFTRSDGLFVGHIASFVSINNIKGSSFISSWIKRLEERIAAKMVPPHETPAMVETMAKNTELKIGDLDDVIVSCENNYFPGITKILHAKSRTKRDNISVYRFTNIKKLPYKKIIKLFDNSGDKIMFTLVMIFRKIYNPYEFKQTLKKIFKLKRH